jgi:hypothetical protein
MTLLDRIPDPVTTAARVFLMLSNVPGEEVVKPGSFTALKKYTLPPLTMAKHFPGVIVMKRLIFSAGHVQSS